MGTLPWVIREDPKCNHMYTCKRKAGRDFTIDRRRGREDRGRGLFQKKCNTDFRLLTSRTLRGYISGVLSHQVFGNELQQPQETNTCIQQQSLKIHETKTDSIDRYLGNSTSHLQMWLERQKISKDIEDLNTLNPLDQLKSIEHSNSSRIPLLLKSKGRLL